MNRESIKLIVLIMAVPIVLFVLSMNFVGETTFWFIAGPYWTALFFVNKYKDLFEKAKFRNAAILMEIVNSEIQINDKKQILEKIFGGSSNYLTEDLAEYDIELFVKIFNLIPKALYDSNNALRTLRLNTKVKESMKDMISANPDHLLKLLTENQSLAEEFSKENEQFIQGLIEKIRIYNKKKSI